MTRLILDKLARQRSSFHFTGSEPFGGISMQTLKYALQKEVLSKRSSLCHATPGMWQAKLLLKDFLQKMIGSSQT